MLTALRQSSVIQNYGCLAPGKADREAIPILFAEEEMHRVTVGRFQLSTDGYNFLPYSTIQGRIQWAS